VSVAETYLIEVGVQMIKWIETSARYARSILMPRRVIKKNYMTNPCIKHNYRPVNNRYKDGKIDVENGEWVTEIRCEVCNKKFEEPRWKEKVNK
jgi:hypothetical protein